MKTKFTIFTSCFIVLLSLELIFFDVKAADTITQERYNRVCKWKIFNPPECKKRIIKRTSVGNKNYEGTSTNTTKKRVKDGDCIWGIFNPPKCRGDDSRVKSDMRNKSQGEEKRIKRARAFDEKNNDISIYTGTFDTIDKEGDDQTSLVGIEHKNENLFRDTWLGRFSPTTGGFVTGKNSIYLYTGIEADYELGPINISPSFAPGYYEAGNGKNLGSALEFKSEIKIGIDLFKNSNLGYSYSHISNNDWGDVNPGTDNQSITFSKNF
jgi:lipid A 3-O-deacylase